MSKNVRGRTAVVANLKRIDNGVIIAAKNATQQLAIEASYEAKMRLAMAAAQPDFTQRFGERLVNEIGVKEMPSGYAVAAPVKYTDKGTAENMYYAEYGAGIMAEGGDSNTSEPWIYKTTPLDSAPVATKKGNRKIPYKWWTKTKGWLGMTDRSRPAHYMAAARRYIRKNWNSRFRKAINTVIYRRAE